MQPPRSCGVELWFKLLKVGWKARRDMEWGRELLVDGRKTVG